MSDNEGGGKRGYRLEYSANNRAKCKGPKPCKGTTLVKGEIRFGSVVDFQGRTSFAWRHWGCVTPKVIKNMKEAFSSADELDGFEDMNKTDQLKITKAFEVGHVAQEDIPESAKKPKDEDDANSGEDEKPKKVKRASNKKAKSNVDEDDDGEIKEKPKRKRAPEKKVKEDEDEDEEKPKKKRAAAKKKMDTVEGDKKKRAPRKKKSAAADEDEDAEDFTGAMDDASEDAEEGSNKRKRAPNTEKSKSPRKNKKSKETVENSGDESAE